MKNSRSGVSGGDEKMPAYELTSDQRVQLEVFFERCPQPDETQRDQLAKDLGLEPKQIEHWFQNKRTKMSEPESQEAPAEKLEASLENQEGDGSLDSSTGPEMEAKRLVNVANLAMEEFEELMSTNEPLWTKASNGMGSVLVREVYSSMFPRVRDDSLNSPPLNTIHEESSRYQRLVKIKARKLVDMFLNSEDWISLFPTIVSNSETIKELDVGSMDNRTEALQVVHEELQAFSPIVWPRELFFLRCCKQIEDGVWYIAHVSIDSFEGRALDSPVKRLPSGVVICELNDDHSMVGWVEHVEVNDRRVLTSSQRDLIIGNNNIAYGAEKWLWALNRMCERFFWSTTINHIPADPSLKFQGFDERRRATRISDRMVESFFGNLYQLRDADFARSAEISNNKIKVSIRRNTTLGIPLGTVASALTCIRLPVPAKDVCAILMEAKYRSKWDVLSCGLPVNEIGHFMKGGNRISFLNTNNEVESDMMIYQDCCVDPLGSYMVYAPISMKNLGMIMIGADALVPILPSGYVISEDNRAGGSSVLLTMAYQIFMGGNNIASAIRDQHMESNVISIITTTVRKIKRALNVS